MYDDCDEGVCVHDDCDKGVCVHDDCDEGLSLPIVFLAQNSGRSKH